MSELKYKGDMMYLGDKVDIDGNVIETVDNPEFIEVITDSEGKVINGTTVEGEGIVGGVNVNQLKREIDAIDPEGIKEDVREAIDEAVGDIKEVAECFDVINDPEKRLEVETDKEGRILSYRREDGVKVENIGFEINYRNYQTDKEFVYIEKPKFCSLCFYGDLPTDESDERIPTTLDFILKTNDSIVLSAKCTLAIQGHGSAGLPKKGYTFEPLNKQGDALEIKFGDMVATDSFHMKAYYTDRTHSRGIGGARLWRRMIQQLPYPYSKVNNIPVNLSEDQNVDSFCIADAKYSEDGFPCEVYLNDSFLGLYTIKLKKGRSNYAMEKGTKSEIFLDSLGFDETEGHSAKLELPFDHAAWELKNPKLKNYDEGGEIKDQGVLDNINRLFNFTSNLAAEYQNYADYIVLPHWLCWYIHAELIGNVDVNGNNLELCTWDGTHWSILPYDMDLTVGATGTRIKITQDGFLVGTSGISPSTFYATFRDCFENELKNMYTFLRKSHCLDIDKVYKDYTQQIDNVPRSVYKEDLKKWPNTWWENGIPTIEQIYQFLNGRIEFLDSIWLLSE